MGNEEAKLPCVRGSQRLWSWTQTDDTVCSLIQWNGIKREGGEGNAGVQGGSYLASWCLVITNYGYPGGAPELQWRSVDGT